MKQEKINGLTIRKSGFPFFTKLSPRVPIAKPQPKRFTKSVHCDASKIDVLLSE